MLHLLSHYGFTDAIHVGDGAQGSVYMATAANGEHVAIKVASEASAANSLETEARLMAAIPPHAHLLPLLSFTATREATLLVSPLAYGGDSLRMMQDRQSAPLAESEVRHLFTQLVGVVRHLHDAGFVHRDIKCENVLLTGARRRTVVLGDLGFAARYVRGERALTEAWGSVHYAAPEIVTAAAYEGPEVDVWSMGVVLYAWATGRLPFGGASEAEICARIVTANFLVPNHVSEPLAALIRAMLESDPAKRLTLRAVQGHAWMRATPASAPREHATRRHFQGSTSEIHPPVVAEAPPAVRPRSSTDAAQRMPSLLASIFKRVLGRRSGS